MIDIRRSSCISTAIHAWRNRENVSRNRSFGHRRNYQSVDTQTHGVTPTWKNADVHLLTPTWKNADVHTVTPRGRTLTCTHWRLHGRTLTPTRENTDVHTVTWYNSKAQTLRVIHNHTHTRTSSICHKHHIQICQCTSITCKRTCTSITCTTTRQFWALLRNLWTQSVI